MADNTSATSRNAIHQMLNAIKRAEIENAKTMARTDKEMVAIIANYIFKEASNQTDADYKLREEANIE